MYNKIFNRIVDSSIWMESEHVRLLFMTFIAIMDEDGFVNLPGEKTVAHRARMDIEATKEALKVLQSPDEDSSNPANEGRRIEQVPGGWMVLNSKEYRDIAKREHQKKLNRERVRKHREKTKGNGPVMDCNETVTPSEAEAEKDIEISSEIPLVATSKSGKRDKRPTASELIASIPDDLESDTALAAVDFAHARQSYIPASKRFGTVGAFVKQCERMKLYPPNVVREAVDSAIAGEWKSWEQESTKMHLNGGGTNTSAFQGDKF